MELSEQQQTAVLHTGSPALVVAGAGSGKTRTLTAKIMHLIGQGFDPTRILAITFTNKAAQEMKSRLYKLSGLGYAKFPWVRTYHSACLVIFKTHSHEIGYSSPIQICSIYQQKKIVTEILVNNNLEKKHAGNLISIISRAKNSANPDRYFDEHPRMGIIRVVDLYKAYEQRLFEANLVDFDNILLKTRDILRDFPEIQQRYKQQFTHILVDEYQDTNNLQDELTRLLLGDHGNLFCVGDDWQAVYGFRGSNVNHFLQFSNRYDNARIFRLEENYRSADEIVQAANGLIDFNADKMDKKCFSQKKGGVVEIHEFFSEGEEAEWVAKRLKALNCKGEGIDFDKIAVVYRTKFCSLAFEKIFRMFKIPYRLMGAQGFFERMEILDINSYLSAAQFPNDDVSFERIINTPKRGIGPAMVKKIGTMKEEGMSLSGAARKMVQERVLTPKIHGELSKLLELLDSLWDLPPNQAMERVLDGTAYFDYLKKKVKTEAEFISKKENIEQLVYTAREKSTILEYLEEAALIREDTKDEDDDGEGVALLTIHSAKGLEFDTVFVVGCEEKLFPHWRSIDAGEQAIQEERRLMYVAMTRAERFLYLSHANYRKGQFAMRSRFIDQIEECMA
ncbi:PcrA1 [Desulforapulum autotrophicum HRM2]|uniref:DNA 3'-5' helicase n=1 Tax=Desulforapulum autotrophicum (strain ATCC 43914 / DSM 3382 / VKM B-1955 / HRM2) TaxID=177437 RepID=C0QC97_DESAH|nr:ATP-dependent helicase [Desulforapulum autotrophicum]ACN17114.1 PcrA1 [Desulforapulum autotrophicum HRM2]